MKCSRIIPTPGLLTLIAISWALLAQNGSRILAANRVVVWGGSNFDNLSIPDDATNIVGILAGAGRNVLLRDDGTVLGGTPDLTNIVKVAGHGEHTLGLRKDGTVVAWGNNKRGQANVPPDLTGVIDIAAGTSHSLALKDDRSVVAWGDNRYGQLDVPVGLTNVTAIGCGTFFSLAAMAGGKVVSWGEGLAVSDDVDGIVAVDGGSVHALGLTGDGRVVAWGVNGQNRADVPEGLTNAIAIAAGGSFSLALRANGTVVAWGDETGGRTAVPLGLTNVIAISASFNRSLALAVDPPPYITVPSAWPSHRTFYSGEDLSLGAWTDGDKPFSYQWFFGGAEIVGATNSILSIPSVRTSESGSYGLLVTDSNGRMSRFERMVTIVDSPPIPITKIYDRSPYVGASSAFSIHVSGSPPFEYQWYLDGNKIPSADESIFRIENATRLNSGNYSVAVKNKFGGVWIGPGSLKVSPVVSWYRSGLQVVPLYEESPVAIAVGGRHFLAITEEERVIAWGSNIYGESDVPVGLTNAIAIAGGATHSVALRSDGTLEVWGNNELGQTDVPSGLHNVVSVSSKYDHTLALRADGTVIAWGRNDFGQCNVPAGLTDVVAVAAGSGHSVALHFDGTVIAWGDNRVGQTNVPPRLDQIVEIDAGAHHTLALRSDGNVFAWGRNVNGQSTVPDSVANAVAIAAGEVHSVALTRLGKIIDWGAWINAEFNPPLPRSNVVAIAANAYQNLGLIGEAAFSPRIRVVPRQNETFTLAVPTVAGRVHRLESQDSPGLGSWTLWETWIGNGEIRYFSRPLPHAPREFFRYVVIVP